MSWRDIFQKLESDELTPEVVSRMIQKLASVNKVLIIKFSAVWCRPCQKIKPFVDEQVSHLPEGTMFCELDIDETLGLYMFLKNKRILKGVPSILAWYPNAERDMKLWYIPDDSVSGGDTSTIGGFFERCTKQAHCNMA